MYVIHRFPVVCALGNYAQALYFYEGTIFMKRILTISLIVFFRSAMSFAQDNAAHAFQTTLKRGEIGKEVIFNRSKDDYFDSLVLVYLGEIKTTNNKHLKILTSRWYWGSSPRATSRIIVFNEKNQYLGDYYLTMTYDVPDKIERTSLVFLRNKERTATQRISFKHGIPKQFFLKLKGELGDIYSFGQNL
jgi:hypothetical protein